ncbi:MAG: metal ABC transporter permease [Devosia sp.]|uniref:metal ABC transporter permease n=1 Tax=Devosia sp. TaxID=1871048 RepID=UPI0019FFD6F0|nr:metal ABC transporter permease [Devosia sp.]MBF0678468.1 metal ABC transporter permease [Devosia sp.]
MTADIPWYELALWPFQFPFMVQAMVIAVLVAVPTALLSCFLVLKGWSLMGDAISHAVLPGVVLAYLVGLPLGVGAFVAGMVCALSVGFLKEHSRIKEDTVMGVVFSGLFGLGIVLFAAIRTDIHLDHILFGNILGVGTADLIQTGIIAVVVTAILAAKWRDLMLFIFDPQQAGAIGLSVRLLHYGLLAMIALTIVGALQAVGIVLVIALLIAPGAIAFLLTSRFGVMLWLAVAISVGCSLAGVYLSFFIDSAPAPTIVLLMSACFIVSLILASRRTTAVV